MAYEVFGVKLSAIVMGLICIFTCFHVAFEIAYIANGATLSFFFFSTAFPFYLIFISL